MSLNNQLDVIDELKIIIAKGVCNAILTATSSELFIVCEKEKAVKNYSQDPKIKILTDMITQEIMQKIYEFKDKL